MTATRRAPRPGPAGARTTPRACSSSPRHTSRCPATRSGDSAKIAGAVRSRVEPLAQIIDGASPQTPGPGERVEHGPLDLRPGLPRTRQGPRARSPPPRRSVPTAITALDIFATTRARNAGSSCGLLERPLEVRPVLIDTLDMRTFGQQQPSTSPVGARRDRRQLSAREPPSPAGAPPPPPDTRPRRAPAPPARPSRPASSAARAQPSSTATRRAPRAAAPTAAAATCSATTGSGTLVASAK